LYFGPSVLQKCGFGGGAEGHRAIAILYSIPLAGINALGVFISIFFVDNLGRRAVLLRSIPIVGVSLLFLSIGLGLKNWSDSF
jgi:hypothetical protein